MGAVLIEEPGEIRGQPEIGSGSSPREDEDEGGGPLLLIEGDTQLPLPFELRKLVAAGENRHMNDLPLDARGETIGIERGPGDRGKIRIVVGVVIFFSEGRTRRHAYRRQHYQ
jgi:hypothetical protein